MLCCCSIIIINNSDSGVSLIFIHYDYTKHPCHIYSKRYLFQYIWLNENSIVIFNRYSNFKPVIHQFMFIYLHSKFQHLPISIYKIRGIFIYRIREDKVSFSVLYMFIILHRIFYDDDVFL